MPPPPKEEARARLRSARQVNGYTFHARDDEAGRLTDFLVDDETWVIRYLVVDTGGWLSGKQVLIAVDWLERIDWTGQRVYTDLTRDMIEGSPDYDASAPVTREEEVVLYDYYQRPQYWI
ncbi:MAG: PRC-barrel domain-containing protein, partial [Candidatus Promineifilaceae bacterium]|nr:PRC-barrel domain-containing protein [Candidatus Promineifilaceae bacterium]